jgi:phosphatidate cytidylyltransferase
MLRTRVVSAAVLSIIVAVPFLLGGWPFLLLVAAAGALGAWEYCSLFRQGGVQPLTWLCILLTVLFIAQAQWSGFLPFSALLTLAVVGSLIAALWHKSPQPATDWALTLAGALYLGWLLNQFVQLRAQTNGLEWLLLGALSIWAADVTAYFAGRAWGRHPWWPRHSPKKTWEGYLAGVAAAALIAGLFGVLALGLNPLESTVLGALIGCIAPLGDLAESMIKRQVGAKDSSHLIPGHGGLLDRIDSLLITVPLVFYWVALMPRWPVF